MRKKQAFVGHEQKGHCPAFIEAGHQVANCPDFERMVIHIRQSEYKKDRIVPLSPTMAIGLEKYLRAENPHVWLFNGKEPDGRYSVKGLSWVMRENLKKTSIAKSVNLHSLRHSYATLFLEQGVTFVAKDYRERAQKKPVSL